MLSQLVTFHVLADHRWEKDNSETTGMLFTLLAHEIHHLWNAKIVNYENETIWLHEGGAAFFEDHTLLSLGLISKEKYRTIRSQELNNCILGLDGISLKNSRKMRRFQNYYRCGSMINLLVEEALKQVPNYNIYSFWGDLIQKGLKTKNRTYTEKMYLQLLQEKTQNPILVTNINKLLNEQITNRTESFQQFFTAVGLRTQVKKEGYSNSYQREIGKMAITNLMQLDCGYQSIYWNKDHIVFDIKSKCNNFKTNTPIARIGGYDVYSGGVPLYDYLHTTCKQKGKIELELKDSSRSTMSFQCDYVFPSRNLPLII